MSTLSDGAGSKTRSLLHSFYSALTTISIASIVPKWAYRMLINRGLPSQAIVSSASSPPPLNLPGVHCRARASPHSWHTTAASDDVFLDLRTGLPLKPVYLEKPLDHGRRRKTFSHPRARHNNHGVQKSTILKRSVSAACVRRENGRRHSLASSKGLIKLSARQTTCGTLSPTSDEFELEDRSITTTIANTACFSGRHSLMSTPISLSPRFRLRNLRRFPKEDETDSVELFSSSRGDASLESLTTPQGGYYYYNSLDGVTNNDEKVTVFKAVLRSCLSIAYGPLESSKITEIGRRFSAPQAFDHDTQFFLYCSNAYQTIWTRERLYTEANRVQKQWPPEHICLVGALDLLRRQIVLAASQQVTQKRRASDSALTMVVTPMSVKDTEGCLKVLEAVVTHWHDSVAQDSSWRELLMILATAQEETPLEHYAIHAETIIAFDVLAELLRCTHWTRRLRSAAERVFDPSFDFINFMLSPCASIGRVSSSSTLDEDDQIPLISLLTRNNNNHHHTATSQSTANSTTDNPVIRRAIVSFASGCKDDTDCDYYAYSDNNDEEENKSQNESLELSLDKAVEVSLDRSVDLLDKSVDSSDKLSLDECNVSLETFNDFVGSSDDNLSFKSEFTLNNSYESVISSNARRVVESIGRPARQHVSLHALQGVYVYRVEDFTTFYTFGAVIGSGGEGTVYECNPVDEVKNKSSSLQDHKFVVKVTPKESWKSLMTVYAMSHFTASMRHPLVITHRAFYEDAFNYYFVMDRAMGPELLDLVKEGGLPEPEAKWYTCQVFLALRYIHGEGLIHCDIKLENFVCAQPHSHLKLIDFGSAINEDGLLGSVIPNATPAYAAPELVFSKKPFSSKIDVWAAGILVAYLLTGRSPYGENGLAGISLDDWKEKTQEWLYVIHHEYNLSSDAIEFLNYVLQYNAAKRPTAENCLKHHWVQSALKDCPPEWW